MSEPARVVTEKTARSRRGHPKTRSGCVTCKKRRVKCDETKPSCLRCIKFWGTCEGYLQHSKPTASITTASKLRPLMPHTAHTVARSLRPNHRTTISPLVFIQEKRFHSQQDHDDFLDFKTRTATQLPGLFNSSLWSQVILQASHQADFIKDAVVAIGALHACGRKLVKVTDKPISTGIDITPHYRFALQSWGRALRKMQKVIVGHDKDLRLTLIACLLVVCFEGLQGNFFQALTHAVNGHALLHAWLLKKRKASPLKLKSSNDTCSIEDELIKAFERLDLQIMTYIDVREPAIHNTMKTEGDDIVRDMPGTFKNVDEARDYWELIQRRTSHSIASLAAEIKRRENDQKLGSIDVSPEAESATYYPESNVDVSISKPEAVEHEMEYSGCGDNINPEFGDVETTLSPPQNIALRTDYDRCSGEISRWFSAFKPFYESLQQGTRPWTAASILHIQAKTTQIMLLASLFSDEFSLDNFTPEFRSICALTHLILQDPFFTSSQHIFTFDVLLVNPIRMIAKWCREPVIRRDAIALLRRLGTREGVWDALVMASVSEYVMEMEEEYMDEKGFIEKRRRVRVKGVKIDGLTRVARVSCVRLGRGDDGVVDERVTVIGW